MDSSKRNMRYIYTNKAAFGAVKPTEITMLEQSMVPQLCTESETVSWLLKQTQKHCLGVSKRSNHINQRAIIKTHSLIGSKEFTPTCTSKNQQNKRI